MIECSSAQPSSLMAGRSVGFIQSWAGTQDRVIQPTGISAYAEIWWWEQWWHKLPRVALEAVAISGAPAESPAGWVVHPFRPEVQCH